MYLSASPPVVFSDASEFCAESSTPDGPNPPEISGAYLIWFTKMNAMLCL